MKSIPKSLSPYTTEKITFHFYFPTEGTFIHFPTNISIESVIVARAPAHEVKAVKNLTVFKKETFKDILLGG
jgi:hypothetical protein